MWIWNFARERYLIEIMSYKLINFFIHFFYLFFIKSILLLQANYIINKIYIWLSLGDSLSNNVKLITERSANERASTCKNGNESAWFNVKRFSVTLFANAGSSLLLMPHHVCSHNYRVILGSLKRLNLLLII